MTSYSTGSLTKAKQKVFSGWSILKASKKFHIPYGTLYNKVHRRHTQKVGTPHRLTAETENTTVNAVNSLANWKVPRSGLDGRLLVKSHLDKQGTSMEYSVSTVRRHMTHTVLSLYRKMQPRFFR